MDDWVSLNGRVALCITWPDTESEQGRVLKTTPEQTIVMHVEYLGDRSEIWFVLRRNGQEVARHNAVFVESVVWQD